MCMITYLLHTHGAGSIPTVTRLLHRFPLRCFPLLCSSPPSVYQLSFRSTRSRTYRTTARRKAPRQR